MTAGILRALLPYRRALATAGWTVRVRARESVTWTAPDDERQIRFYRRPAGLTGVWVYGGNTDAVTVHLALPGGDSVHLVVDLAVRVGAIYRGEMRNAAIAADARGGGAA